MYAGDDYIVAVGAGRESIECIADSLGIPRYEVDGTLRTSSMDGWREKKHEDYQIVWSYGGALVGVTLIITHQ